MLRVPNTLQLLSRSASKCRISVSQTTDQIITDYNPLPTFLDGVPTIRALETITFGDEQAATMKADMTEADLSGKKLGVSGAIIVAAFLPKCQ